MDATSPEPTPPPTGKQRAAALGEAAALGLAAGARSGSPLAALALKGRILQDNRPLKAALLAGAALEVTGDKHPLAPRRTLPPALAGRITSAAIAGRVAAGLPGAGVAAAAAAASTFATYRGRLAATDRLPLPSPVLGSLEDALVAALLLTAVRSA